jgi:glycosyltransferase involved in cell wall biosynthesis
MGDPQNIQVLFVGLGSSRISWYRAVLPALYLGCDWIGVVGEPPKLRFATGYVKGATQMAQFENYDCVVVQQVRGHGWFQLIQKLQARGIPVLYEIDDYVQAIRKAVDHDFRHEYKRDEIKKMELCMRRADGMICSTEYLARRYRTFNKRVWVCPNGLDMARYRLSRPSLKPTINGERSVCIGWAGATGHTRGITPWMEVVARVMSRHQNVRFMSIGYPFAEMIDSLRALSIPFTALETYPAAMMSFDIALAPAGNSGFYKAKSPLRAMEAGALGIPVVADPALYGSAVIDGQTGMLAATPQEAEDALEALVTDERLRLRMGAAAREHVAATYDMRVMVEHWKAAIVEAVTEVGVAA